MARKDPGQSAGWIKLHRSITGWRWARDPNVFRLWVQLLLMVDYETGEPIRTTQRELAEETGLSVQMVKTALAKLRSTGEIHEEFETDRGGRTIWITNWDIYQSTRTSTRTSTRKEQGRNATTAGVSEGGKTHNQPDHQPERQPENASPSFIKKELKKKSEETRTREGTFDTEDFFQAAVRRSYAEFETKEDTTQ